MLGLAKNPVLGRLARDETEFMPPHRLLASLTAAVSFGTTQSPLPAHHYEDVVAADPRIDALRAKMVVTEDKTYSADYLDPNKRSIANAVQVFFRDGSKTERIAVEYPLGHRRRRSEGLPFLVAKAEGAFSAHFGRERAARIVAAFRNAPALEATPVDALVEMLV